MRLNQWVTKKRNIKNYILCGFFSKYLYFKNDKKMPRLNIITTHQN